MARNIVEIFEDTQVTIIQINQGPKGDPGEDGVGADAIESIPPSGGYKITNFYLNSDKKLVVVYEDTPIE